MMTRAAAGVLFGILAGCAGSPPRSLFVLSKPDSGAAAAAPAAAASAAAATGMPVLQVAPVLIPDYLDSTDIQWRVGEHELKASPTGRWGERLSVGISNALRSAIAARLPDDVIVSSRAAAKSEPRILITVDAFDAWPDGHCVLAANWTMTGPGGVNGSLDRGIFTAPANPVAGSRDAAVVAGMSTVLDALAERIVRSVGAPR
jgi:uncharacterized lipoprotein YmbA